jgi:acyl-CoA reductase-like NAD-dependent aldehyde dehydrogenase
MSNEPKKRVATETADARGALAGVDLPDTTRLSVPKAYKMYVGGAFIRSESGRCFQTRGGASADAAYVNIPAGSRKDIRDAILIAKNAQPGWAARTAYNRGQILYRLAEVLEARTLELRASLERAGVVGAEAAREVGIAVDRSVYYAGMCDKVSALLASHNPVSGPHFGFTLPEPTGVIGVVPPERPALLGLVSCILPVIASGNTVVSLASEVDPRTAIVFAECLATSDVPAGVVNLITGSVKELAPHLAKHREVNGIDAHVVDGALAADLERSAADSVKRVTIHCSVINWHDDHVGQGLGYVERFLEHKSIWHPVGV